MEQRTKSPDGGRDTQLPLAPNTTRTAQSEKLAIPAWQHDNYLTPTSTRVSQRSGLYPTRSYVDGHSYISPRSSSDSEPNDSMAQNDEATSTEDEKGYKEVTWDGPDDPMNPKNFKTWRYVALI